MNFAVEFDPIAELEYLKAIEWYEEKASGLGDRFVDSVESQIDIISRSPLIYPSKRSNSRESVMDDFPYIIVYKFSPDKNLIYIVSIFHTSRNPKKKYGNKVNKLR